MVQFSTAILQFVPSHEFASKNSGWKLVSGNTTIFTEFFGDNNFGSVVFTFKLKRRPEYFLSAAVFPIMCLVSVQLAAFLLPPELPDRTAFAMAVLLAFSVLQSQILTSIPKTPEHLYVNDYMLANMLATTFSTIQSAAMCFLLNTYPKLAKRCCFPPNIDKKIIIDANKVYPIRKNSAEQQENMGWQLYRIIDVISFLACLTVVGLANMIALMLSIFD